MTQAKKVVDVLYHIDFYGNVKPLSDKAYWEIDFVKGSTNRLIVDAPLSDSFGISTEQEIIFKGRRFVITELQRERNSANISITADESQIELASRVIKKFTLKDNTLAQAIAKAVTGSKWTVGTTFTGDKKYFAEIENKSSMYCLTFLARQSGGQLVFDSINRVVSIVKDEEIIADVTYRYKNNLSNIIKKETQPEATILYPYGRDGMTIEALNKGKKYIEDFTWYTDLGLDIEEARARFSKEVVWEDSRYIYNNNLFEDAKKKLALMAYPTISYELDVAQVPDSLDVNSYVYVVDEELGIKLKTSVVRIRITKGGQSNSLELSYVPPSLGAVFEDEFTGDASDRGRDTSFFQVKNQSDINLNDTFSQVVVSSVTVFSSTAFEVGFTCQVESTAGGLIEGYWTLDNTTIYSFKQTVPTGWHTIGVPFVITAIPEGTKTLVLNMKTSGTAKISREQAEMYVKAQGVYGGASNERPDQTISETITINKVVFGVQEQNDNLIMFPEQNDYSVVDFVTLGLASIVVSEKNPVVFLNPPYVDPEPNPTVFKIDMTKYQGVQYATGMPTQSEVDSFTSRNEHNLFRVITLLSSGSLYFYVLATTGTYISVDYSSKKIISDGVIYSCESGNTYRNRGSLIDWSVVGTEIKQLDVYYKQYPAHLDPKKLPATPNGYVGKNYVITSFSVGDPLRMYYYNGYLTYSASKNEYSTNASGWYSYKFENGSWVIRSSSDLSLAFNAVIHYCSQDVIAEGGSQVVRPKGY